MKSKSLTLKELFEKYDVPAPRYTSYPTVPYWEVKPTYDDWLNSVIKTLEVNPLWSLYIHIPFCENLCSYCGCNTIITKNHNNEKTYIDLLLKEWESYLEKIHNLKKSKLFEFHLGGGTPNFLSPENLDFLLNKILTSVNISNKWIGSMEIDPRHCNEEHLKVLSKHNFNRVSLGVQDFNIEVQKLVNRVQSFEKTKYITELSKKLGFDSINFDLIYGLPNQNLEKIKNTIDLTIKLSPDRIALYSLAIIPWLKPAQKLFKDSDLPLSKDKRDLYEFARDALLNHGYVEVGMDHFALPTDQLAISKKNGTLHRNFMGYTPLRTDLLLGLGMSAISETPDFFIQNFKEIDTYKKFLENNTNELFKGHSLNLEDKKFREIILKFMTKGEVELENNFINTHIKNYLKEMFEDELVHIKENKLQISERGKPFLRNACMALDMRMFSKNQKLKISQEVEQKSIFSKAL